MKYEIVGEWLFVGGARTKFWNEADLEWLESVDEVRKNKQGYMIMPYGHADGVEVYPELHGEAARKSVEKSYGLPTEWIERDGTTFAGYDNPWSYRIMSDDVRCVVSGKMHGGYGSPYIRMYMVEFYMIIDGEERQLKPVNGYRVISIAEEQGWGDEQRMVRAQKVADYLYSNYVSKKENVDETEA